MKIIEAMKKVKGNLQKISDLQEKIKDNSAHLSIETPVYKDADEKIKGWAQSCEDISQENIRLLTAISRTNLETKAVVDLGGKQVTKTVAEWIWRRREYAQTDGKTYAVMTDRGLREGVHQSSTGVDTPVTIIRKYDPELRDKKLGIYRNEPLAIDATLEVVNAITDLIEV